jgi:hypothetical protein
MRGHFSTFPGESRKSGSNLVNITKQRHWLDYDNDEESTSKQTGPDDRGLKEEDQATRSLRAIQKTSLSLQRTGLTYSEASRERKLALIQTLSPGPVKQSPYNGHTTARLSATQAEESPRKGSAATPSWAHKTRRVVSGSYEAGKEGFRKEGKSTYEEALKERQAQRQRLSGESGLSLRFAGADTRSLADSNLAGFEVSPRFDHGRVQYGQTTDRTYSVSPAEVRRHGPMACSFSVAHIDR